MIKALESSWWWARKSAAFGRIFRSARRAQIGFLPLDCLLTDGQPRAFFLCSDDMMVKLHLSLISALPGKGMWKHFNSWRNNFSNKILTKSELSQPSRFKGKNKIFQIYHLKLVNDKRHPAKQWGQFLTLPEKPQKLKVAMRCWIYIW